MHACVRACVRASAGMHILLCVYMHMHGCVCVCVCINFVHTNICGFIKSILQFFSNEKTIKVKVTGDL